MGMIPLQLTLKNFLSYRSATLDFRGLHIACICGANGAGKSSLLEAIAWAIWGQSRAVAEDDVIHLGEMEVQVDFLFQYHQQDYRIIRSRYRGQSSALEFQVQTPKGWRSLTGRGMRATQQLILQHLKLDYDTFINSAYLRQGRADEFMLKRPSERKQILADLLKLGQYDHLAEQSKERSRQLKAEIAVLERNLAMHAAELEKNEGLAVEQTALEAQLAQHQQQHELDQAQLRQLQGSQQQRSSWQQRLGIYQQQYQHLQQDCQRLHDELTALQQQQQRLEAMLQQTEAICTGYAQFQQLQAKDETQTQKFQAHQAALSQHRLLQQQQLEATNLLKDQLRQTQAQLEVLHQQRQELQQTLSKAPEVEMAVGQLQQARTQLAEYDHLQAKATPLLKRQQELQTAIDRLHTRLTARLEELQLTAQQLLTQNQRQPQLQQAILDLTQQVTHLEQRRIYQQRVREKGLERRSFMERLQAHQRNYELKLAELDHKIAMLRRGFGVEDPQTPDHWQSIPNAQTIPSTAQLEQLLHAPEVEVPGSGLYPPCPLCDRPLDEHHWSLVLEKHQAEQQEVQGQLWVIREQLSVSEREIQVLRQEYRDVDQELVSYGKMLERRGQLQEQFQGTVESQQRLQQVISEQAELERSLQSGQYAPDLSEELRLLENHLHHLNYDDKNHAIARGEVDRWRWAEIKQAEIKQAQRQMAQLTERQPQLEAQKADLEHQLANLHQSPLQHQLDQLEHHLAGIRYSVDHHNALRSALRQAQVWQLHYQELLQAQQRYPQVQQRVAELEDVLAERRQALQAIAAQMEDVMQQLARTPDHSQVLQELDYRLQQGRSRLDELLARLGRLQQQRHQMDLLRQQLADQQRQLDNLRRQQRVYQELAQAFGRNGLQALMIENILPQLEAEANRILGQLSTNQLHVQFLTQRAGRRKSPQRTADKLIDTLDILIADVQGTRPYETYSGGEAFRVNFAIRLALARLLAQRSGTALQMLIVDEGFGTQDDAGCNRLIGAINAIAPDFACILMVTHMPHFKEAFQTRIEVTKTAEGSQVHLLV
jgi:exonuclease SbcC